MQQTLSDDYPFHSHDNTSHPVVPGESCTQDNPTYIEILVSVNIKTNTIGFFIWSVMYIYMKIGQTGELTNVVVVVL